MKKDHKINSNSVVGKLSISLEIEKCYGDKIFEKFSNSFKLKLHNLINEEVEKLTAQNNDSLLGKLIFDLGEINFENFEREFIWRLERELKNKIHELKQNLKQKIDINVSNSEKIKSASKIPSISQYNLITSNKLDLEQSALEDINNYLKHGIWKLPISWQHIENVEFSYWLMEKINLQPQQWLPMLAKHCLQSAGLSRLNQICQPDVLSMLCQLFTETTISEFIDSQSQVIIDRELTPEKLSLAAEYYLQHQMRYAHATQKTFTLQTQNKLISEINIIENSFSSLNQRNIETNTLTEPTLQTKIKQTSTVNITQNDSNKLKQTHNETDMQMDAVLPFTRQPMQTRHQPTATQQHYGLIKKIVEQNPATLQNRNQPKELLKSALSAQISSIQPSNGIQIPSSQSVLPISNAGCMILWPLLPTFFRTFDLLEKNQFISLKAQREAVCLLDWLIWEEEEIPAWRLTLNKILCGLPIHDNALWHTPKPEQQIAINQWLEKTLVQLPAWKKMGTRDVRHLFLQRSGELSELNGITNIHIKPEVYDALISKWPWPMNIASFSWLQHPITITWL
ncbi:contractile injection system tape measure protein [Xenorhabdus khoisanae]|uniref:contractile injection system tape measure protein n=1 Tax=Xenorhabdus khoisanae TaxID=880157 RepID=UPI00235870B8|nr:contractile injection system tape measure protein [Xenorhabdus khoisanae]MDC9614007.1 contractile injection system tape measure protein [Xenorhabdus khoisanae]